MKHFRLPFSEGPEHCGERCARGHERHRRDPQDRLTGMNLKNWAPGLQSLPNVFPRFRGWISEMFRSTADTQTAAEHFSRPLSEPGENAYDGLCKSKWFSMPKPKVIYSILPPAGASLVEEYLMAVAEWAPTGRNTPWATGRSSFCNWPLIYGRSKVVWSKQRHTEHLTKFFFDIRVPLK